VAEGRRRVVELVGVSDGGEEASRCGWARRLWRR
jgi:hypothetical protein